MDCRYSRPIEADVERTSKKNSETSQVKSDQVKQVKIEKSHTINSHVSEEGDVQRYKSRNVLNSDER